MNTIRKGGLLLAALGVVLLAVSLWKFIDATLFVGRATSTVGVVVGARADGGDEDGPLFHTVVRFAGPGGEQTFESNYASVSPLSVGSTVEVLHLPGAAPRIHDFRALWAASALLMLFGGAFSFFGFIMIAFAADPKKGRRPAKTGSIEQA